MRDMPLSHTVLLAVLWCAAVFAFVGSDFMKFENAGHVLRQTRISAALGELRRVLQFEMDRGEMLAGVGGADVLLRSFAAENDGVSHVAVYDKTTGKALFSTAETAALPPALREKCAKSDFTQENGDGEIVGMTISNAFDQTEGCVVAAYDLHGVQKMREAMISTAFKYALRLAVVGILACFLLYFATRFSALEKSRQIQLYVAAFFCFLAFAGVLKMNFSAMTLSFLKDLRPEIELKAKTAAAGVANAVGRAVESGESLKSVNGMEAWLNDTRRDNPEILFILVTDKTGRVLYETGSVAEAFDADARTGKIALRAGYYNTAVPVGDGDKTAGWVQIGVRERIFDEKDF